MRFEFLLRDQNYVNDLGTLCLLVSFKSIFQRRVLSLNEVCSESDQSETKIF